jgi:hypothetical protein
MFSQSSGTTTVAADSFTTLTEFQEGLPVRLIATRRADFKTCSPDEAVSSVVARNTDEFDYFPIVESGASAADGRIIGLLNIVKFTHADQHDCFVRDRMDPLTEDNLIGADASILTFFRHADQRGCRLVVSGLEIYGLVTLSDLQRLPVRASLFAMVTHLEMIMANAIRKEFTNTDGWLARLSDARQAKINRSVAEIKSHDAYVEHLLFTQFADKREIIKKSRSFQWDKDDFYDQMKQIEALRNDLAHANAYAPTRETAVRTCETVRFIDLWIERLS